MLVPTEELRFDFGAARFDPGGAADRARMAWIVRQFLYGEVTGIQCGYWLYRAPTLAAASFLARQAQEEMAHVRRFVRILQLLDELPGPPHWAVRYLSTGMMGGTWGEHVCLEMALGEGLVLSVLHALADTCAQPEIERILRSSIPEEERHVEFGERETRAWLAAHPGDRARLAAEAGLQIYLLRRLRRAALRALGAGGEEHPVLARIPEFYEHCARTHLARASRLGLSEERSLELGGAGAAWAALSLPVRRWIARRRDGGRLLTRTYLADPWLHEREI